jgi:hypothetical protein
MVVNRDGLRGVPAPGGPNHREATLWPGGNPIAKVSVAKKPAWRGRLLHALAEEAEDRYRHELADDEERLVLRERIIRLKKRLAAS